MDNLTALTTNLLAAAGKGNKDLVGAVVAAMTPQEVLAVNGTVGLRHMTHAGERMVSAFLAARLATIPAEVLADSLNETAR